MIDVIEIEEPGDFSSTELRQRVQESTTCALTKRYKVMLEGAEVGFVSVDRNPSLSIFCLYELWVARPKRGMGVGSAILHEFERIAREERYSTVTLRPEPLDDSDDRLRLIRWYTRHGYKWADASQKELVKEIRWQTET
jgi:GNAT superfamily N-acetyltransferase